MKEWLDKMPSYEELKKIDKEKEYIYHIFSVCGGCYFRFTYNEDLEGFMSVDYLQDRCLHSVGLPIRHKTKVIENKFYRLNKKNYNDILKYIDIVKEAILENIKGGKTNE